MLGALQPQREIPRATIVITHYFHYFFPIVSCFNQTNSRKTAKMASGGDDWDTVTYLRKKPQSASALKTDKVILERDILRSHLFYRAELYEASLSWWWFPVGRESSKTCWWRSWDVEEVRSWRQQTISGCQEHRRFGSGQDRLLSTLVTTLNYTIHYHNKNNTFFPEYNFL